MGARIDYFTRGTVHPRFRGCERWTGRGARVLLIAFSALTRWRTLRLVATWRTTTTGWFLPGLDHWFAAFSDTDLDVGAALYLPPERGLPLCWRIHGMDQYVKKLRTDCLLVTGSSATLLWCPAFWRTCKRWRSALTGGI